MPAADIFLSFPIILGAIAIMAIFGPGKRNVFLAIAFFGWPIFARVFRAAVLSIKERGFVKAARVLGASSFRILFAHVLPNSMGPLISYAAMMVAAAIMAEAGLSYIHLGVQRPEPSWGLMLSESTGQFENDPWLIIVPGCAVTFTVLAFTLLSISVGNIIDTNGSKGTRGQT
jgi:ABC-type dipeptide/oligopeptide/nickel transport system permease subunit